MTKEQIQWLVITEHREPMRNMRHDTWVAAFAEYNADHPNARPLQLTCLPCYKKVAEHLKTKYNWGQPAGDGC